MKNHVLTLVATALALGTTLEAEAGIEACGNIRFDEVQSCELRLSAECSAGCSELGVYKTACATKLVPVCKEDCTLDATPTCTDSCTTQCSQDCDNGVNVICTHNCFTECTTDRDAECAGAANVAQCEATWNANCDSECDLQCVTVDGDCYQHCVECCGGSCSADANMTCQTTCQDELFEDCEYEFRIDCDASCSGDGALFCDGEFMISGSQLPACLEELVAQGIGGLELEGEVTIGPDGIDGSGSFCTTSNSGRNTGAWPLPFVALAAASAWLARRRRQR